MNIMTFEQFCNCNESAFSDAENAAPKSVRVFDSRSGKTLYSFTVKDSIYIAKSNVKNIDNDEVKTLPDITGKTYTLPKLKTFLSNIKGKYNFINVSQKN